MGKPTKAILVFIGLLLVYLLSWPVDAEPVVWTPPPSPEMKGQFEPNDYLQDAEGDQSGLSDDIEYYLFHLSL